MSAGSSFWSEVRFAKSSFSGSDGCVEVAFPASGGIRVRDSKDPGGPVLSFNEAEWLAFLQGVHAGEFELPAQHLG